MPHFQDDNERLEWEADQKMLDREWYDNDGGYDDEYNPFAKVCNTNFVVNNFIFIDERRICE